MIEMILYKDERFGFYELFNEKNGTLIRGDVNGTDPVMRSFPELLDVGIMGHCNNGGYCKAAGIDCYQRGAESHTPHMSFIDFKEIVRQSAGKTFQIALGGAGDPNKHPLFTEMLRLCKAYHIVPNITTSGFMMTDREIEAIQKYCGAAAVSWYSRLSKGTESNPHTINAVKQLVDAGCIVNVHYVVSADTIPEAIFRLEEDFFPSGIHAVIFILYKPVGNGIIDRMISISNPYLQHFISLATEKRHPYRIGFDTCFTPALLHYAGHISKASIDACEAAAFSMYIDSQLNCFPCSFGLWHKELSESMREKSLRQIWNGNIFSEFRARIKNKCVNCELSQTCRSGCRLNIDIDLC